MYARQSADGRGTKGMKVPPNYGGSAFSGITPPPALTQVDSFEEEERKTVADDSRSLPTGNTSAELRECESGGLFRFFGGESGGIGLEELLILGLVLLISQNDVKDDLAFLLLLLVFIK